MNIHSNFASALLRAKIKKEEIKKPTTLTELSNNGWTILKRNNTKITILTPFNEQFLKKKIEKKQIILVLNKMISNWNNFRDKDIELNGDLSLYFNYKSELEKLINEDNIIEEMFDNDNNSVYSDNDCSDDGFI
jgi:hypothetical protein|tara:strand:+ start:245 stop:646 length:402 start_codon:yes stop_codon:yes gene_type:complete